MWFLSTIYVHSEIDENWLWKSLKANQIRCGSTNLCIMTPELIQRYLSTTKARDLIKISKIQFADGFFFHQRANRRIIYQRTWKPLRRINLHVYSFKTKLLMF